MPNRTVNHNNRNRAAYQVDGNTVRRMEAMPDYRKERRDRQEREREEELRKRRRAAARNQEKALRMSKKLCRIPDNGSDRIWRFLWSLY